MNQDTDVLIEELLNNESFITDDDAYERLFEEVEFDPDFSTLLSAMTAEISSFDPAIWDITGVNCAVHTLQLSVKDALSNLMKAYKNVIELCRRICKFLRLKSTSVSLDAIEINHVLPRLETPTRWGSMYLMVSRFIFMRLWFSFVSGLFVY